jgi:hypothetical protein
MPITEHDAKCVGRERKILGRQVRRLGDGDSVVEAAVRRMTQRTGNLRCCHNVLVDDGCSGVPWPVCELDHRGEQGPS